MIESVNMYGRILQRHIANNSCRHWLLNEAATQSHPEVCCVSHAEGGRVTCQCGNLPKHYLSRGLKVTVAGIFGLVGEGHFGSVIFLPQTQSSSRNMRNCSRGTFYEALLRTAKVIAIWDLTARERGGHTTPVQGGLSNESLRAECGH